MLFPCCPSPPRSVDERTVLRRSHENPVVQQLYDDFLEKPNSHKVGGQQIWAMNCGIRSGGMAGRRVLHCTQAKRECGHSVCHSRTKPAPAHPLPSPPLPLQAHELLHTYYVPCGPEKFDITAPVVSRAVMLRSRAVS